VANKTDLPILGDTNLKFTVDGHKFLVNVVSENCIVPAKHKANVPVKFKDGDPSHPLRDWTTEPRKLDGVIAA